MDTTIPSIDELLKLAKEELTRNRITSAERSLEQVVLMNNKSPEAFYLLGQVYVKKGKFKKAILAFKRALHLDPFLTDAAIALSSLYNDVGKYQEGAVIFNATKKRLEELPAGFDPKINRQLANKHYELGLLYMRFERFHEAHHEFTKAYNLNSDEINYAIYMAKSLAKSGDKKAAIVLLKKVMENSPKNVDAKVQLGILYHSERQLMEAKREWQEVLSIDPHNKFASMYLSMFDYEPKHSVNKVS